MARKKKVKDPVLSDVVDTLVHNAYNILNWKFISATQQIIGEETEAKGLPKGYYNFDFVKLEQIVKMVEPLLKDAQATRKVEAQSANEIIRLIGTGKISITEAMKLMALMKVKLEVEEKETKLSLQKQMLSLINQEKEELLK